MGTRWLLKFSVLYYSFLAVSSQVQKESLFPQDVIVDEETLHAKWSLVESQLKRFADGAVQNILPKAVEAFHFLNISSDCVRDAWKVIQGFKQTKSWAFKFLDASTMSVSGIQAGTIGAVGNFDECINIEVNDETTNEHDGRLPFSGMYCTVHVRFYLPPKPKNVFFSTKLHALNNFTSKDTFIGDLARSAHQSYFSALSLAICVPSSCTKDDINQVLGKASDYLGILIKVDRCEVKEETKLTSPMIAVLTLFSVAGCFSIVGTLIDVYSRNAKMEFRSTHFRILKCFSIVSNFQKLTNTSTSSGVFSCLNGMKCFLMFWIITAHTYTISTFEFQDVGNMATRGYSFFYQIIVNCTFVANTFFFITGILLSYNFIKTCKIQKKQFNLMMHVVHRFLRIFPTLAFVLAIYFLLPLMGSGPNYRHYTSQIYDDCCKNWWNKVLFISNYYSRGDLCFVQSWYLAADMQFYIFALIILLPLIRWPRVGLSLAVIGIVAGMVGSWATKYMHGYPLTFVLPLDVSQTNDIFAYFYILPQAHISSYCIGIMCGYLLVTYPNLRIPIAIQVFGWCASVAVVLLLFEGTRKWNVGVEPTFLEYLFYSASNRTAWTMAVAWITVCCCTGHGGIVNYILSWKIWTQLGRTALWAYLIHPAVLIIFFCSARTATRMEERSMIWYSCAACVVTFSVAFCGTMLLESPFLQLEKVLLSKRRSRETPNTKNENNQTVQDPVPSGKDMVIISNGNDQPVGEEVSGKNIFTVKL